MLECIAFPANIIRIIGETETHYEIWAMPTSERPSKYDPKVFNFRNFPWVFAMAQACSVTGTIQKVGTGLDVYHMNVRKPGNRHFIYKGDVELFRQPPFTVSDGKGSYNIVDYMFLGVEIYRITEAGTRIPLLVETSGVYSFPTDWRCSGLLLIPPR